MIAIARSPASMLLAVLLLGDLAMAQADVPAPAVAKGIHSVADFGAKGDGKTDDTAAFQKALDAASAAGGGITIVPRGDFLIKGHLSIPPSVALEGTFRAPTARNQFQGSTLLAVEGKGNPDGEPFIFLNDNSTLKGVIVFYPDQEKSNPVPYPWCIRGKGNNCSIQDVQLINPWQAVDFGTYPCGRHLIRGLYAQPLRTGIFVDKCLDVGRIEDVHLWPFWDTQVMKRLTLAEGTAFIFGRTDWQMVNNCFCIFFKTGFQFTSFKDGPGNVMVTNSGSDLGPTAVRIDSCQPHAGLAFTNGQFMAGIDIRETNRGPVKFNNCGFWGIQKETARHADIRGSGHVTFNACHFISWDRKQEGQPAIFADGKGLTVSSCDFMDEGSNQIVLGENLLAAIIMGNRLRGGIKIKNESKGKVEIGLNIDQ